MPALPDSWVGKPLKKLHRCFELLKCYSKDSVCARAHHRPGLIIQLYLNSPGEGGATRFIADGARSGGTSYTEVEAREGRVLVCEPGLLRQESEVRKGVKYVMRTYAIFDTVEENPAQVYLEE